jgi:hypothetical protein
MRLRIVAVLCGAAAVAGTVVLAIELPGYGGLPVVTVVPTSIPSGGVALWQADQHGRPTGLGAYLHRPRSPSRDMSMGQAEVLAREINNTSGLRVAGATLASVTLPGTALTVSRWRTLDAWIVTLDFPHPSPLACVGAGPLTGQEPSPPCQGFTISKNLVLVDARTGTGWVLLSTN